MKVISNAPQGRMFDIINVYIYIDSKLKLVDGTIYI